MRARDRAGGPPGSSRVILVADSARHRAGRRPPRGGTEQHDLGAQHPALRHRRRGAGGAPADPRDRVPERRRRRRPRRRVRRGDRVEHPDASSSSTSTEPVAFALPSGNIACTMSVDGVTCTIASYTYAPPVVAGCTEMTGHVLVLNADGVAFDCVSGPPPAVAGDDVPVLEYGLTTSVGDYTCRSATDGVQCTDASGTGFQLARASWSELPGLRRRPAPTRQPDRRPPAGRTTDSGRSPDADAVLGREVQGVARLHVERRVELVDVAHHAVAAELVRASAGPWRSAGSISSSRPFDLPHLRPAEQHALRARSARRSRGRPRAGCPARSGRP